MMPRSSSAHFKTPKRNGAGKAVDPSNSKQVLTMQYHLAWRRLKSNVQGGMNEKKPTLEKLLTPREVASWLDVSVDWVQDHATVKEPRIPVVRIGKLLRFRREDIEVFLSELLVRRPAAFSRNLTLNKVAKR